MGEFFAFLVLGIIRGMVYGIIALGINLIYKGSRTLNLAQPFMGLFAAYIAWYFTGASGFGELQIGGIETGPWFLRWLQYPLGVFLFDLGSKPRFALAAVISLLLIMRVGYRLEHDLFRRLADAPRIITLVATIALSQGFLGIVQILFERTEEQSSQLKTLPALLPDGASFTVGPLPVSSADVQILIVVPLVAAAAAAFFKLTKFGVAIRASAENREAAQLLGISARRVASFTWIAAGFLAGLAALLIVPSQGSLDAGSLGIGLLIRALAASLVGGLVSLPGAFAGGLIVGVTEFLIRWQTSATGVPELAFFLLVIVILLVRPGGIFGQREQVEDKVAFIPQIRDLPARLRRHPVSAKFRATGVAVGIMLVSAVSLATGPFTNGVLIEVLVFAIVGVSLTVLVGYAGQISLGHFALVGVGAFTFGRFFSTGPVPFWLAIPLAVVVGMLVSLVIGFPSLRIRGPYLAVVTLAFAIAAEDLLFSWSVVAQGTGGILIDLPSFGPLDLASDTNRPLFFLGLAFFLICAWVAYNFKGTRSGRGFFSLRENEKAALTFGVELTRYRLMAFMVSGGMAALAGVLFALRAGQIDAQLFETIFSLLVVAMVIIGGLGSLVGPVLGAFLLFGAPPLLQSALGDAPWVPFFVTFASGIALILVITRLRGGLAGLLFLPRDPVVQGLVWQEEDAIGPAPVQDGLADEEAEEASVLEGLGDADDLEEFAPPDETVELERVTAHGGRKKKTSSAKRKPSSGKKKGSSSGSRKRSGSGSRSRKT